MQIDIHQVLLCFQAVLFQGKMTVTCFHKRFYSIVPRQCAVSHSPSRHILNAHSTTLSKQVHFFPHQRNILVEWVFLIQVADSYLFTSFQSQPLALKILPRDILAWPVDIFIPTFSIQCDNILLPFVCRRPVLARNNRMWGLNPTQSHVFCNAFSNLLEFESLVRHPLSFWPNPSEGPYTEHPQHRPLPTRRTAT